MIQILPMPKSKLSMWWSIWEHGGNTLSISTNCRYPHHIKRVIQLIEFIMSLNCKWKLQLANLSLCTIKEVKSLQQNLETK